MFTYAETAEQYLRHIESQSLLHISCFSNSVVQENCTTARMLLAAQKHHRDKRHVLL